MSATREFSSAGKYARLFAQEGSANNPAHHFTAARFPQKEAI